MRATIYPTPANPYYPGYAEPDAVYRERFNEGPMPGGLPRRTTFAGLGAIPMRGGTGVVGGPTDPIARFGRAGAALVIREMKGVPREQRTIAIKATLDSIEPGLADKVSLKAKMLQKQKGYPIAVALEKALSATFANRLTNQLTQMGRGGAPLHGLLGLGSNDGCHCAIMRLQGQMGLGLSWGDVKNVGKKIVQYSPPGLVYQGGKYAYQKGVKPGAKAVAKGAEKAYGAGKKALKGLGKLTCAAANSGLLEAAAGPAAGAAGGGPQSAEMATKGAAAIKNLCGGGAQFVTEDPLAADTGTVVKVAAVGGGLALLAFLL